MANYPDRRSAALPALAAAQRVHGWCSPEAIEQVACVMRVTPAYLESVASFYDMLETEPVGRHSVYVCTNISCSLRGADALLAAVAGRGRRRRGDQRARLRVPRRVRHRADGLGRRRLRGTALRQRTSRRCSRTSAPSGPCCPSASSRAGWSPTRTPTRASSPSTPPSRAPRGAANLELPTQSPQTAIGEMSGERRGPTAAHEQRPEHEEEDES